MKSLAEICAQGAALSGLTDAEWALIEPHMSEVERQGRPRETELRSVLDAILYLVGPAASGGWCRRTFRRFRRCKAISTTRATTAVYRNRRLAKDFEASIASAKAWVYIASVQLLIRRLA